MSIHSKYVANDQIVRDASKKFTMTQSGFVRVANIGPAIMLIERKVMEAIGKDASLWRLGRAFREVSGPILEAFSAVIDEHGRPMSEDVSFCRRWTNLGGEIWACASEEVTHVGRFAGKGRMEDQLMHFQDVKP